MKQYFVFNMKMDLEINVYNSKFANFIFVFSCSCGFFSVIFWVFFFKYVLYTNKSCKSRFVCTGVNICAYLKSYLT